MRRNWFIVCLCIGVMAIAGQVGAVTLTFDDLVVLDPINDPFNNPLVNYGGLTWESFYYLDGLNYNTDAGVSSSGFRDGVVSERNVAYNAYMSTGVVSSSGLFNFESVYLTAAWENGLTVDVAGYLLASTDPNFDVSLPDFFNTVTLSSTTPTFFQFNYLQVAEVWFSSDVGGVLTESQFVMDNFTYTSLNTSPVPEPASIFLFGTGLVGIGALRKRFKRS